MQFCNETANLHGFLLVGGYLCSADTFAQGAQGSHQDESRQDGEQGDYQAYPGTCGGPHAEGNPKPEHKDAAWAAAVPHEPLPQARETEAAEEQQRGRRQNRQHTEPTERRNNEGYIFSSRQSGVQMPETRQQDVTAVRWGITELHV